ncbi:hypothetical protein B9Q08_01545 [Candidatus Marsarchaeota G2 archaeon ECH_B_SAG-M15]|uniref:DUF8196 domain-containing protein n=1 Tax=Candidatus Marsarchaeota G2 archaeon ECH_B_SAG-M15 TaxID=1978162 RepID=A0A2R6B0V6_9ARCH|nr:MAG: hypothetical protein B9Q08_01545 [Candidatus Marsarchaeota G2 archaeon ECH_B_SAG-M15]
MIKNQFLELLDQDEEFRLAVAAKLGITAINQKLDKILENQEKLWLEVKSLREGQEKLWQNVEKLWLEVKSLREGQEKLWQNVEKLWLEVKSLREGQEKLWIEVRSLRENQEKLWLEQRKMSKDLHDALTALQRTTLTEEEEASEVVAHRLRREFGIELQISPLHFDSKEVDLYASKDDFCVIGEATTRLGKRLVIELDEKVEYIMRKKPELLKPRYVKVIYTIVALGEAIEEAKQRGIWVLTWKEELTPITVHTAPNKK